MSICCGANTTSTPHKRNATSGSDVRDKRWQLITQGLQSFPYKNTTLPGTTYLRRPRAMLWYWRSLLGCRWQRMFHASFYVVGADAKRGMGTCRCTPGTCCNTFFFPPLTAALHKRRGLSFQGNVLKLGSLLLAFDLDGRQKISRWQPSALRQVQYITKTETAGGMGTRLGNASLLQKVLGCTCVVPPEK